MKIGAAQMELVPELEQNFRKIKAFIAKGAELKVDIMNFPEASLTGYHPDAFREFRQEEIEKRLELLHQVVEDNQVGAVVGTPYQEKGQLYNSVVVLLPDGRKLLYHKQNLVHFEGEYFVSGDRNLVFQYRDFTFGTIVCRDQNFPALAQKIKKEGADVLFISCAHYYSPMEARWKLDKNVALPIARATENSMYVCKANAVGSLQGGLINLGNSLIAGPNGVVVARAGEGREQLLTFAIDPNNKDWHW